MASINWNSLRDHEFLTLYVAPHFEGRKALAETISFAACQTMSETNAKIERGAVAFSGNLDAPVD